MPVGAQLAAARIRAGEVVADRLHERQEGQARFALGADTGQDLAAAGGDLLGELGHQPGLADARVAGDEDRAALTFSRFSCALPQQSQLGPAPDQHRTQHAFACHSSGPAVRRAS